MLICKVEFKDWKCRIDVEYQCLTKKSRNLLYSKVSSRWPSDVYCNYSVASDVLKHWNAHECEIKDFLDDIRDPNLLNNFHCTIQRAFTIIPRN